MSKTVIEPEQMIIGYIRKKNAKKTKDGYIKASGPRVGVMVAGLISREDHPFNKVIVVGFSLCNKNADKYDLQRGLNIAIERCMAKDRLAIPSSVVDQYRSFLDRCKRYYNKTVTQLYVDNAIPFKRFYQDYDKWAIMSGSIAGKQAMSDNILAEVFPMNDDI